MATAVPTITILAPLDEVEELLRSTLSPSERASLQIEAKLSVEESTGPERQGEFETVRVVIEFVASAVAGGIAYDLIKKIAIAAVDRFGKKKVK